MGSHTEAQNYSFDGNILFQKLPQAIAQIFSRADSKALLYSSKSDHLESFIRTVIRKFANESVSVTGVKLVDDLPSGQCNRSVTDIHVLDNAWGDAIDAHFDCPEDFERTLGEIREDASKVMAAWIVLEDEFSSSQNELCDVLKLQEDYLKKHCDLLTEFCKSRNSLEINFLAYRSLYGVLFNEVDSASLSGKRESAQGFLESILPDEREGFSTKIIRVFEGLFKVSEFSHERDNIHAYFCSYVGDDVEKYRSLLNSAAQNTVSKDVLDSLSLLLASVSELVHEEDLQSWLHNIVPRNRLFLSLRVKLMEHLAAKIPDAVNIARIDCIEKQGDELFEAGEYELASSKFKQVAREYQNLYKEGRDGATFNHQFADCCKHMMNYIVEDNSFFRGIDELNIAPETHAAVASAAEINAVIDLLKVITFEAMPKLSVGQLQEVHNLFPSNTQACLPIRSVVTKTLLKKLEAEETPDLETWIKFRLTHCNELIGLGLFRQAQAAAFDTMDLYRRLSDEDKRKHRTLFVACLSNFFRTTQYRDECVNSTEEAAVFEEVLKIAEEQIPGSKERFETLGELYHKELNIFDRAHSDPERLARMHINIGYTLFCLKQYHDAQLRMSQAINELKLLARGTSPEKKEVQKYMGFFAVAYDLRGRIYDALSEHSKAFDATKSAIDYYSRLVDPEKSYCNLAYRPNLAYCYLQQGVSLYSRRMAKAEELKHSREWIEKSITLIRELVFSQDGYRSLLAVALAHLTIVHQRMANDELATESIVEAAAVYPRDPQVSMPSSLALFRESISWESEFHRSDKREDYQQKLQGFHEHRLRYQLVVPDIECTGDIDQSADVTLMYR